MGHSFGSVKVASHLSFTPLSVLEKKVLLSSLGFFPKSYQYQFRIKPGRWLVRSSHRCCCCVLLFQLACLVSGARVRSARASRLLKAQAVRMSGCRPSRRRGPRGAARGPRSRGGGPGRAVGAEESSSPATFHSSEADPRQSEGSPALNPAVSLQGQGHPSVPSPFLSRPDSPAGIQSLSSGQQPSHESCVPAIPGGPLSSTLASEGEGEEEDVQPVAEADEAFVVSEEGSLVVDEDVSFAGSRSASPSKRARASVSPQAGPSKEVMISGFI